MVSKLVNRVNDAISHRNALAMVNRVDSDALQ
jgi:hypothetical protein